MDLSLNQDINSVLKNNRFFPTIRTDGIVDDTTFIIYDGFTYLLDYRPTQEGSRVRIQYLNTKSKTPENILFLTNLLDTFAFTTTKNTVDSFSIGSYLDTLKKISSYDLPPLPISPPANMKIKFKIPKKPE